MRRLFRMIPLVAVVVLCGGSAHAADAVLLQYQFKPKEELIYRVTGNINSTQKVNEMTSKNTVTTKEIVVQRLDKMDGKKNFQLESENKRLEVSLEIGPLGKYTFDSTSDDNERGSQLGGELTPVYETLSGAVLKVTMSPRGEVLGVRGYESLLLPVLKGKQLAPQFVGGGTNKAAQLQQAELFPVLSNKPVKPGDTWVAPLKLQVAKLGEADGRKTYKYAGLRKLKDRSLAKITYSYDLTFKLDLSMGGSKISGELAITKGGGTALFDPAKGHLVSLKGQYELGGDLTVEVGEKTIPVRVDQTQTFSVEQLQKLPE